MRINHNIAALNTHRQLGANNTQASKNLEKLSSGLKINRAGDDAAGLAISEKMRGQIRGLDMAQKNSQDGISLIQTAEGSLNETHAILQRMRELAVQASNDTNTAEDRSAMQEEINQLTTEIDRISTTTEFNTKNLLDGSFSGKFQIGANSSQQIDLGISAMGSNSLGITGGVQLDTITVANAANLSDGTYTVKGADVLNSKGDVVGTVADTTGLITLGDDNGTQIALGHAVNEGTSIKIEGTSVTTTLAKGSDTKLAAGDYKVSGSNLLNGDKLVGTIATTTLTLSDGSGTVDMTAYGLEAADLATGKTFTVKGIDISTADKATASLDTLDSAIKSVSAERSKLGAIQNRLEHTINNLGTSSENLTAAESRIRDVDYVLAAA